jgi:hypothetical protein
MMKNLLALAHCLEGKSRAGYAKSRPYQDLSFVFVSWRFCISFIRVLCSINMYILSSVACNLSDTQESLGISLKRRN